MNSVNLAGGRLRASRLGFGTSTLHHLRSGRARADLLEHCFARGLRYYDTAPLYGHEQAERQLGQFIRSRRSEVILATKFGIPADPWMARSSALLYAGLGARAMRSRLGIGTPPWRRDYSEQSMAQSLERSLRNLRTDHVDVFFAHEASLDSPGFSDELVRSLERIRAQGKARFLGFSGSAEDCVHLARRYPEIADLLQIDTSVATSVAAGAAASSAIARLSAASLEASITFGHFRQAMDGAGPDRATIARERLQAASAGNPHGVILFSSRSTKRIDQVIALLGEIDRQRSPAE
jgi:aryl-alcohol dehydrogenase-like predicted oxidoreductase